MLAKNQQVELEITDLTHEGNGVGRAEGMAVFVPRTAPGDRITAQIVQVRAGYAYGILKELRAPSPLRVDNDCPAFARCGGCTLRHVSYPAELAAKEGWVRGNLSRIGKLDVTPEPIVPSPRVDRYRNKAQYPVRLSEGQVRAGFFAPRSHRLIPVGDCRLQPELFGRVCREICAFAQERGIPPYDEETHTGLLRHIFIRQGEITGQVMVCLVLNGRAMPGEEELAPRLEALCPQGVTLCVSPNTRRDNVILGETIRPVTGSGWLEDELAGVTLRLSPHSFYQVNHGAAERLYRLIGECAGEEIGLLLDLYCGTGAIGLSLAGRARQIVGVETVAAAVADARENAARCGVENAEFLCADAARAAVLLKERRTAPDVVVVDPPRKGVPETALRAVAAMGPERIVYVSCNSATLARDCRILADLGYRVNRLRPVDLFPRTAHVECCCLLTRQPYDADRG